jgi:hypothetical protein
LKAASKGGGLSPHPCKTPTHTAVLGRMGGKVAVGESGSVTALLTANDSQLTVEFAHGRVPFTRHSRDCLQTKLKPPKLRQNGPSVVRGLVNRIQRLLHQFQLAVSQGHEVWISATVLIEKAAGVSIEDVEGQQLTARAVKLLRQRCVRLGHHPRIAWTMERGGSKRIGLHVHLLVSCPPDAGKAAPQRAALRGALVTALEVSPSQLKCPALKFHSPASRASTTAEASGWWRYCVSGAVPAGQTVLGIAGKTGNLPVSAKAIGWSAGRHA